MATEKVSLTLDRASLAQTRRLVGKRGLSSYVDEALRLKLQRDRLGSLLGELEREHGPVPRRVTQRVEREWPPEPRNPRKQARRRG